MKKVKLIKWLANTFGYKIAMIKTGNGETSVQGDKELLRYCDIIGYVFKKEPLRRVLEETPKASEQDLIKPLSPKLVKELLDDMDPKLLEFLKSTGKNRNYENK
jgi:hypothetical protein